MKKSSQNKWVVLLVFAIGLSVTTLGRAGETDNSKDLQKQLVQSNNEFAIKLYAKMAKTQVPKDSDQTARPSFCYSPYSIAALSQIVKVGTGGETEKQLQKALCLTLSGSKLNKAYLTLMKSLMAPPVNKRDTPYELAIANRLWLQKEERSAVLPAFKQTLKMFYLSGIKEIDFSDNQASVKEINDWVSEKTKQHIKEILSLGDITPLTRFVALNAVYFQGTWRETFNKKTTTEKPFYASDGKTQLGTVPTMRKTDHGSRLGEVDGVSILSKPYRGGASMVVVLPPEGDKELDKLEASLSTETLEKWLASVRRSPSLRIELPKFELENKFPLIGVMKQLGVTDLFTTDADFSRMVQPGAWKTLHVAVMRHKATIQVDEEGTIATGATVAVGTLKAMPRKPQSFIANRPFLFLIVDDRTAGILFLGRYTGPEKK